MKNLLVGILKIILYLVFFLFILLVVVGVVYGLDLPWWTSLFILAGLVGIWMGCAFLKKIWMRKREQRFVNQIIETDDAYTRTLDAKERGSAQELQQRWKEAVDALRRSHLRKYGNPLYVLPWYMIIGESGAGKTTAIKSARLSSSFAEVSSTSGISGTRNCDWWFFEKAVIIDTAGRYAIPVDDGRDKDEWRRFLSLLCKFRKKEPLNGLVIAVAADKLLNTEAGVMEEDGRHIRTRIDELMQVLGAKFPVYVMVTKCDLVRGMTRFCDQLSDKNYDQAMGAVNQDFSDDAASFVSNTIDSIIERLKDLRLLQFNRPVSKEEETDLLIFPEEFSKLKSGLEAFIRGAFSENPYQESPILRGCFFSSGKQEGSPFSHFLKNLGLIDQQEVLPGTDKGLFLHEFFSKILPRDRRLYAPTRQTTEWSRLTRNMGLTAWLAIAVAVCGLLSYSFVKNLQTLRSVSREFMKPSMLQGEVVEDTITMDRFREAVLGVEKQNRSWWIPRLGLHESREIEDKLKARYCDQYRNAFLKRYDEAMAEEMAQFSSRTPDSVIGRYVAHLVKRINLLHARLNGENLKTILKRPQPTFDTVSLKSDQYLAKDVNEKLTGLYRYFLIWQQNDKTLLNQEMSDLQAWLKHILTLEGKTLNWLVTWANADPSLAPIRISDFWGGTVSQPWEIEIPPAYSVKGKEKIDNFISEIDTALFDPLIIAKQKRDFNNAYFHDYLTTWHDFAKVFSDGPQTLENRDAWARVVSRMGSDRDPYLQLFSKMADELKPYVKSPNLPQWVLFIQDMNRVRIQAVAKKKIDAQKDSLLEKASKTVMSTLEQVEKKTGSDTQGAMDTDSLFRAANGYNHYKSALSEIIPAASSRRFAYELAVKAQQDTASEISEEPSPFEKADHAVSEIETMLVAPGSQVQLTAMTGLLKGPVAFLHEFVFREAACHLEELWETQVLIPVNNAPANKNLNIVLMGENGIARQFIEGPAKPFIGQQLDGRFFSIDHQGEKIAFNDDFLAFLTKSAKTFRLLNQSYGVLIDSEPTGANRDARLTPHETALQLQCGSDTIQLVNHNYPVSKTIDWSPLNCTYMVLKVEIGSTVLRKEYSGYLAFAEFVDEFKGGQRVFFPREFPAEEWALKGMGVKYITIKYRFKGQEPVLDLLHENPGAIPEVIVECWE